MSDASAFLVGSGAHDTDTPDAYTATDAYAQRFAGPVGRWLLERQATGVLDLLAAATADRRGAPLRILEVGGGHAQLTGALLQAGHHVVVHGSDSRCFERPRRLHGEHPRLEGCVASSLWRLPFPDRAFDLVIAVRLLAHVLDWQGLLAEMARVSDRWLLVEFARTHDVGERRLGRLLFTLKKRLERATRPFFTYREPVVASALETAGFRVRGTDAQFALPMVLHRTLRSPGLSRAAESALLKLGVGAQRRSPVLMLAERAPEVSGAPPSRHEADALATDVVPSAGPPG